MTTSRAIVMRRTGGPEVLAVEDVARQPLASGEVRLRALASAVNQARRRPGSQPGRG